MIAARIIAGFVAIVLLAVTGVAWATLGTTPQNASDATDAAGDVGVVTGGGTTTDANGKTVAVKDVPATNILIVGSDARTDSQGNPLSPGIQGGEHLAGRRRGEHRHDHDPAHPGGWTAGDGDLDPPGHLDGRPVVGATGVVGPYSDGTSGPYKPNKINSFYGTAKAYSEEYLASKGVTGAARERQSNEAGRTMLIKVVQQFTGLKINHYAEINLIGFYLLSNAIGGMPVCLNAATKDRQSGADFPAGELTCREARRCPSSGNATAYPAGTSIGSVASRRSSPGRPTRSFRWAPCPTRPSSPRWSPRRTAAWCWTRTSICCPSDSKWSA